MNRTYLTFKELENCFKNGQKIDWHDEYQHKYAAANPDKCILTEEWKDRPGPLVITHLSTIAEKDGQIGFVGYLCSDAKCKRCIDKSLILQGHHKLIRFDGIDIHQRFEFVETKKKTDIITTDQPVFKKVDE